MSVVMLTRNDCTQCAQLKMLLKYALNDKYVNDIKLVNKEDDIETFDRYVAEFGILTLPALIAGKEALTQTQPSSVVSFLEKHIGKK